MTTPLLENEATELDVSFDAGDHTFTIAMDPGDDVSGMWTLHVRDRARDRVLALGPITMTVVGQVVSHDFDLQDLLDLIPHTGTGATRVYLAAMYVGFYTLAQNEDPVLKGRWRVSLTAQHGSGES